MQRLANESVDMGVSQISEDSILDAAGLCVCGKFSVPTLKRMTIKLRKVKNSLPLTVMTVTKGFRLVQNVIEKSDRCHWLLLARYVKMIQI